MQSRQAEKILKQYSRQFRALAIIGPRQSGKTTLVKKVFARKPYISLEDPDERMLAANDPKAFLSRFKNGAVIDEAQRVPELFNYLQKIIDSTKQDGLFILTGSNNFLLQQNISQTLAGRIGYIDLLPLSYAETIQFENAPEHTNDFMLNGTYPELYDKNRKPGLWYPAYIRTYIERDVKQIRNIENTLLFNRFIQLCAGRTAQQLNVAALSIECGIDVKTVQAWLGVLVSSYIIYLLPPYHKNYNKRIVKTPKLYFIDTGLVCSLLGIRQVKELSTSHFRGALFENYVVMDVLKQKLNSGSPASLYYWKENNGLEIDLLIDTEKKIIPVEIKAAETFAESHLKNIIHWNKITGNSGGVLLYDGTAAYTRSDKIKIANWKTQTLNFKG